MNKKWSIGIKVLGYLFIFLALLPYLAPLISSISSGTLALMPKAIYSKFIRYPWFNLTWQLGSLIIAIGLFRRLESVRILILVLLYLLMCFGIGVLFYIPKYSLRTKSIILFFIVLFYSFAWFLSHPKVAEQFKKNKPSD